LSAVEGIAAFVERRGDRSAEIVWGAALEMIRQAAEEAKEGKWGRWRHYPKGELRRLRRDLAEALELAHLAVALQEEERAQHADLDRELHEAAVEAGRRRRRAQTLPAEQARLENARRRRDDREREAAEAAS
jgi:hypothetical protein